MTAAWSAEAYACCQPWKQARYSAAVVALVRIIFTGAALVIQKTLGEKRHGGHCEHSKNAAGAVNRHPECSPPWRARRRDVPDDTRAWRAAPESSGRITFGRHQFTTPLLWVNIGL